MRSYVRDLKEISISDVSSAGGKGSSLGEMVRNRISVPKGFVVLVGAYRAFMTENGLLQKIEEIVSKTTDEEVDTLEKASKKIRKLFDSAKISKDLERHIFRAFEKLNTKYVAVRSSATMEDSFSASWAGQLETYLNTTKESLSENIKKCWSSLFTPRAIVYRMDKELPLKDIGVAIVIQEMVQSDVSGNAFSVHPVTQDRDSMVIEAVYGLGEALVGGNITPDTYVIQKSNKSISKLEVSNQSKALSEKVSGGSKWRSLPNRLRDKQKLSNKEIQKLSALILRIERHYNYPVDVEWVKKGSNFFITQSRPITTLFKEDQQSPVLFKKLFTRDYSLVIQQLYQLMIREGLPDVGWDHSHRIVNLGFMKNGVIQAWENAKFTEWFFNKLLEENRKGKKFFDKWIEKYNENRTVMKEYYNKIDEIEANEFKKALNIIQAGMFSFLVMFYSGLDDRTPPKIKRWALKIREKDAFWDTNDNFIRKFLVSMFPQIKGYEVAVLLNELKTVPSLKVLKQRKKHFVVGDGLAEISSIQDFLKDHPEYHFDIETTDQKDIIKGQTGNKGKVSGIAKVLMKVEEGGKVKKGDIIISPMTTPNYLPAMKKAAAFVTDEGGITCHAAIVARELGKPCVIGTKFATEILHDGDEIEVDATKGIVRIISKK